MEVERSAARLLGMEVDLPRLAQRVGLDEVALVVDVETVVDGVILEVGDEAGHVDDGHVHSLPRRTATVARPWTTPCLPMRVSTRCSMQRRLP